MRYCSIQVFEDRKPIEHLFNKDERTETIMSDIPEDKLAKVKYGIGITINIGNYQSAKVDIGVEYPAHVDEVDEKYEEIAEYCMNKLGEEITTLTELKKVIK